MSDPIIADSDNQFQDEHYLVPVVDDDPAGDEHGTDYPLTELHAPAGADTIWVVQTEATAEAIAARKPAAAVWCWPHPGEGIPSDLSMVAGHQVVLFCATLTTVSHNYEAADAFGKACVYEGATAVSYVETPPVGRKSIASTLDGKSDDDGRAWIERLAANARKKPAEYKPKAPARSTAKTATGSGPSTEPKATKWTDSGVAERWVESVDGQWRWTAAVGFMQWDGHVWAERSEAEALESMRQFGKSEVIAALKDVTSEDAKLAVPRLDAKHLKDALSLGKGQMVADLADFDQDPDVAVAPNVVIDLRTGESLAHDSSRLVTKSCGVDYVPGMTHPDWDQVLTSVPPEVADYLQLRFGQMLTGYPPDDDVMMILRGGGENAKTTMIAAIRQAFSDYAVLLPDKVLLGDTRDHSTEMMPLRGSRMGYVEELPEARHLNTQRLKKINGSAEVAARHVHRDNVTFKATWGLAISTNFDVLVEETDRGSWRRLQEIRYPYTYKKAHEPLTKPTDRHGDPRLRDAVRYGVEQQQAVLAWLVEGARRWYANGRTMPPPPEQVVVDTLAWRKLNDQVLAFAEDHLVVDADSAIWIDDLHGAFGEWLRGRSHNPWAVPKLRSRFGDNEWLKDAGAYFTGRTRRDPLTVSRPEAAQSATPPKPLPAQGQFLVGVRFRTRADDLSEIEELRSESGDRADALAELTEARAAYEADVDAWRERAAAEAGVSPEHVALHTFGLREGHVCKCRSVVQPSQSTKDLRRASGVIDKRLDAAWKRCDQLGVLPADQIRLIPAPMPDI